MWVQSETSAMMPHTIGFAMVILAAMFEVESGDLDKSFQSLKVAQSKNDVAAVQTLAAETCALARKMIETPQPAGGSEKDTWTQMVAHAKDVEVYTEYALYAVALQAKPDETVSLMAALERQNPKSKYLEDAYGRYFIALRQTGASAKVLGIAEKAIASFPKNEDLLMVLAEAAMNQKQRDRSQDYAERLIVVLKAHPTPEGMAATDWGRKRAAGLGLGYWIAGLMHVEKAQYYQADQDLRAALPLIKDNDQMTAAALFNLGLANYQFGMSTVNKAKVLEGAKFSEMCASYKSPYAQQAWTNAHLMRREATKLK